MKRSTMLWVLAALLFGGHPAFGQTFPQRPIRMVVPFPAGGSIDIVARAISQHWITNLMGELFKSVTGVNIVHVPFKGLGQAMPEFASGRVHLAVSTVAGLMPHVKAGRMKGIVSSGARRSPQLPDVPTCIEVGLPGFHSTSWHAIVAPAGTPKPIILKLQQTLAAALASPELRDQLIMREDAEPVGSSPEELARFLRSESAKWAKVIKSVGVKAD